MRFDRFSTWRWAAGGDLSDGPVPTDTQLKKATVYALRKNKEDL